jgi:cold shock CspA family protein
LRTTIDSEARNEEQKRAYVASLGTKPYHPHWMKIWDFHPERDFVGVCTEWDEARGFGRVLCEVGTLFVHRSKVLTRSRTLTPGDTVIFRINFDVRRRKPQATDCEIAQENE